MSGNSFLRNASSNQMNSSSGIFIRDFNKKYQDLSFLYVMLVACTLAMPLLMFAIPAEAATRIQQSGKPDSRGGPSGELVGDMLPKSNEFRVGGKRTVKESRAKSVAGSGVVSPVSLEPEQQTLSELFNRCWDFRAQELRLGINCGLECPDSRSAKYWSFSGDVLEPSERRPLLLEECRVKGSSGPSLGARIEESFRSLQVLQPQVWFNPGGEQVVNRRVLLFAKAPSVSKSSMIYGVPVQIRAKVIQVGWKAWMPTRENAVVVDASVDPVKGITTGLTGESEREKTAGGEVFGVPSNGPVRGNQVAGSDGVVSIPVRLRKAGSVNMSLNVEYSGEFSTDGGSTWTPIRGTLGREAPLLQTTAYEYIPLLVE